MPGNRIGWAQRSRMASAVCAGLFGLVLSTTAPRAAEAPIRIKIVGGLAGISQYTQNEEPFWRKRIHELSQGRIEATIAPNDRSGLRGEDMLRLMRLGVVQFGTALVSVVAGDEPELSALDLPGMNPDIDALNRSARLYRPHLETVLRDRYDIELLGIYTYPAQVIFCAKPFAELRDLAGRRIRTSSVAQSEMMAALGATPVITPFAETARAVANGIVDCAITGTLSGVEIGLAKVTSHMHTMAISWGVSVFGANRSAWAALPPHIRTIIRQGVAELEGRIWQSAALQTERGFACGRGDASCSDSRKGSLTLVPITPGDDVLRRRLLAETVIPKWVERCGPECAEAWNTYLAPKFGLTASLR